MDDLTLGEMLTAANRRQVDYFVQEGMSVSQSSSMDQCNLMEKWSIDQGNLMSVTARKHRLGLFLKSKDKSFLRSVTNLKSVILQTFGGQTVETRKELEIVTNFRHF